MKGGDRRPAHRRLAAEPEEAEENPIADESEAEELERKRREFRELNGALTRAKSADGGSGRLEFGFSYMGLRVRNDLRRGLEAAAKANGCSLASEVRFRLELSLRSQDAFLEALELLFDVEEGEFPAERVTAWLKQKYDGRQR
jgi:hypothetical protein